MLLEELGCLVTVASNGQEALEHVQTLFDLIFMDISLPDTNGLELTTKILQSDCKNKHTPIIAMTAHVLETDQEKYIAFLEGLSQPMVEEHGKNN